MRRTEFVAAGLLAAAGGAQACGYCVEDKVASVEDKLRESP